MSTLVTLPLVLVMSALHYNSSKDFFCSMHSSSGLYIDKRDTTIGSAIIVSKIEYGMSTFSFSVLEWPCYNSRRCQLFYW